MAAGDIVEPRQAPPGLVRLPITAVSHHREETPMVAASWWRITRKNRVMMGAHSLEWKSRMEQR
jgi:hypothetical protein